MSCTSDFANFGYNTAPFNLAGLKCWARIVACHDGDSPTLIMQYAGQMYKFHTRMFGIDTCEITSKDASLKQRAVQARNRLIQLATKTTSDMSSLKTDKDIVAFLSKDVYLVWVECLEFDKYARVLVKLRANPDDDKTFSDVLIEENLAYAYFGATKMSEKEQAQTLV